MRRSRAWPWEGGLPVNGRSWDIIGRRRYGYALSLLIILPGLIALILHGVQGRGALNWGIDFTGGNFLQLRIAQPFTEGDVRPVVDQFAVGESIIQKSGQEVLIRTRPMDAPQKTALIAAFAMTRKEVNSSFVGVLLTVVGYSINDTIVVFDRIRENLALRTREAFDRLVNRSILEALVRSINTAMTTILAIGAVFLFGGSTIHDFAFGLM